jgi:hypothetical protein
LQLATLKFPRTPALPPKTDADSNPPSLARGSSGFASGIFFG